MYVYLYLYNDATVSSFFLIGCIDFTVTPPCVRKGQEGILTMECGITETDAIRVYNIKIKRETAYENRSLELLASFEHSEARLDSKIIDNKSFTVAGNMSDDKAFLRVTMDTQTMTWSDARNYECEVAYDSRVSGRIEVQEQNATLTVCGNPFLICNILAIGLT